ncbi:MAG: hypothetical protein LQ346_006159, partial [Caloplaca aetnensis]
MGRKRRSTHNNKRAQATRSPGRPSKRNHNVQQRIPFVDLPGEIRDAIVENLRLRELATLVRTSKSVQAYLERRLYNKIYTKIDTPHNTAGLVGLLQRRTHIAPMIETLVLDEYHPRHTRRLLSIEMPNLWCLFLNHDGDSIEYVSEREKRALNRKMVEPSGIIEFVLRTSQPLTLSKQDACLFRQPDLNYLCFKGLDFSAFETASHRYLNYTGLTKLFIQALKQLIAPSKYLTVIHLHHLQGPVPFEERDLCSALSHTAGTLKLLELRWTYHPPERDYGFDLSRFTALRMLRIEPGLLLGPHQHKGVPTYISPESPHLPQLIRNRLPPNLKLLLLESLTFPDRVADGPAQVIADKDLELIRCLLKHRDSVAPKLTRLHVFYKENMAGPEDLFEIATRAGMVFGALFESSHSFMHDPWMDSDE